MTSYNSVIFQGTRAETEAFINQIAGKFYVYILSRPDGSPFYVGKGINRRLLEHEAEARRNHPTGESNPFKCNVIRKILRSGGVVRYQLDSLFEPGQELQCLEREAALIAQHRRLHEGGTLTNLAGGLGNMSGSSPHSLEKHSATLSGAPENNPQRAVLNQFLLGIGPVESVPIKPLSQISRVLPTTPHPSPRQPTLRGAYALIAGAIASGLQLVDGVAVPRCFQYRGVQAVIENGVARDILKAAMATLVAAVDPKDESFLLREAHIQLIVSLVGREMLVRRGLL